MVVTSTISILLFEMYNDTYIPATFTIQILRITLIIWAQKKLGPELSQSIAMLRFAVNNSESFSSPKFAYFISICQLINAIITLSCMLLFVCMADHALELVMNFAGLSILSELDDWIGNYIVRSNLNTDEQFCKSEELCLTDINSKMSLHHKMSFLVDYLEITDDQNWEFSNSYFIQGFSWILDSVPFWLLPLSTIPIDYILVRVQTHQPLF